MEAPATAPQAPTPPAKTHGCARCGAPVPLDVGLCERCNPLGLSDSASSQVHGTVFVAVALAIVVLVIVARLAVTGIGPFRSIVADVSPTDGGLAVTLTVTNDGTTLGSATCRVTGADSGRPGGASIAQSPRIGPGETATFVHHATALGTEVRPLTVECFGP